MQVLHVVGRPGVRLWCIAEQVVAEHPSNAVLRNDDPDGADMSWTPLAREVAGASDAPLPLLNAAALRRAVTTLEDAQASVSEQGPMCGIGRLPWLT